MTEQTSLDALTAALAYYLNPLPDGAPQAILVYLDAHGFRLVRTWPADAEQADLGPLPTLGRIVRWRPADDPDATAAALVCGAGGLGVAPDVLSSARHVHLSVFGRAGVFTVEDVPQGTESGSWSWPPRA